MALSWFALGWMALVGAPALAHPLAPDRHSYRVALRVSDEGLEAVAVLEIPFAVVMSALKESATGSSPPTRAIVDAWNQRVWSAMDDGLLLTVDGWVVPGRWQPSQSRFNGSGSAGEGFFVYIVEFVPEKPWSLPTDRALSVLIANRGWADVPMALSAWVIADSGWRVGASTTRGVLPDDAYDVNDPRFWVDDPGLRMVAVTLSHVASP